MEVSLRSVKEVDKDDMYAIYKKAIEQSDNYSPKRENALLFSKDNMPERLYRGNKNRTVIAEIEGNTVGWASLFLEKSVLDGIYVDPDYQGRSIGSTVLSRIESLGEAENLSRIALITNPGIEDFYLKNGYMKVGESMVPGLCSDDEIFCIVMMKNLSN